jgi:hypothetical protein
VVGAAVAVVATAAVVVAAVAVAIATKPISIVLKSKTKAEDAIAASSAFYLEQKPTEPAGKKAKTLSLSVCSVVSCSNFREANPDSEDEQTEGTEKSKTRFRSELERFVPASLGVRSG